MPAGGGDFQGALDRFLCLDFRHVDLFRERLLEDFGEIDFGGVDFYFPFQKSDRFAQVADRNDLQTVHHRRFRRIFHRHQQSRAALGPRTPGDGQDAFDRAHHAGQGQFTHHDKIVQLIGLKLVAGRQHADGNREIEARAFLFHVSGREIDRGAAHEKLETGIGQSRADAVLRFLHRRIRQPDDGDDRIAPT